MDEFKIKKELLDEWKKSVGENATDPYSFGVLTAVVASFEILDDPKCTAGDAESVWSVRKLGLSGFMAGCAAGMVAKFHERGDEFRMHWNKKWGVDETKAQGGVVNPAILTVNE